MSNICRLLFSGMNISPRAVFLLMAFWMLPFASMKLLVFGWPLYPVEMVLLVALPFLISREQLSLWRSLIIRKVSFFAGIIFMGATLSLMMNPWTLWGIGQLKSFFAFPILFFLLALSVWRESPRNMGYFFEQWRLVTVCVAFGALVWGWFGGMTYDDRLRGWFDSPNMLAMVLAPGVLISWWKIVSVQRTKAKEVFLWLIMMLALGATRSYAPLLVCVVGGIFLWWKSQSEQKISPFFSLKILSILGVFLGGLVFFESGTEKWSSLVSLDERSSFASRIMIWRAAEKMIIDHPLVGIGPGRFQEVYLQYQQFYPPYLEWAVPHPHNLFFAFWLSTGLLGVIALLWLLIFAVSFGCFRKMNKEKALSLALLLSFFGMGFFDVPYFRSELCYLFWLAVAVFATVYARSDTAEGSL